LAASKGWHNNEIEIGPDKARADDGRIFGRQARAEAFKPFWPQGERRCGKAYDPPALSSLY